MTAADELDEVWAEARAELAENLHSDDYSVLRTAYVSDGRGGRTETQTEIESGKCMLTVSNATSGGATLVSDLALKLTSYQASLPITSSVTVTDTLVINGRSFSVRDVKRGGDWGIFTVVQLIEED